MIPATKLKGGWRLMHGWSQNSAHLWHTLGHEIAGPPGQVTADSYPTVSRHWEAVFSAARPKR